MSDSTNQANEVLAQLMQRAMDGVDAAVEFSQAQIPDVVEQLLMWRMAESIIHCLVAVVLFVVINYGLYKAGKWMVEEGCGELSPLLAIPLVLNGAPIALFNMDWLKIMIAPKLYLLEYAASLVK